MQYGQMSVENASMHSIDIIETASWTRITQRTTSDTAY